MYIYIYIYVGRERERGHSELRALDARPGDQTWKEAQDNNKKKTIQ